MAKMMLDVGVASRPCCGLRDNGDSYYTEWSETTYFAAVIDGLGHGLPAAEASRVAVECLEERARGPMDNLFRACHEKLRGTRGVAAGVASIDLEKDSVEFVGVGNIEAIVYSGNGQGCLISTNGILGADVLPHIHVRQAAFPPGSMLIMHSDGISSKFKLDEYYGLKEQSAQFIADVLLRDWGRTTDDATVLVVRREMKNEQRASRPS